MWISEDTLRVLRQHRGLLCDLWVTEAQKQLPHLDPRMLRKRGALRRCAGNTLTVLGKSCRRPRAAQTRGTTPRDACAAQWAALPLPWSELHILHRILADVLHGHLSTQGTDPMDLVTIATFLNHLEVQTAGLRLIELEQQVQSRRDENLIGHYLAGRFLANASHELRTPLTVILGFADLLLEETYGPLSVSQRAIIGHIENATRNLQEIVNNLLDLLKVRTGELKLFYRLVEVTQLIHEMYRLLSPLAARKRVRFEIFNDTPVGYIRADENILRHILYYLLTSSLRATPAGGLVELSALRQEDTVTILIRDTALHLPSEVLTTMSDPFPRLENSPARGYEGWEVGLPLVHRYVDLHGGRLEIDSLPGSGTVFRVILNVGVHSRSPACADA